MISLEMNMIAMKIWQEYRREKIQSSIKVVQKDMIEIMGLIYFEQFLIW